MEIRDRIKLKAEELFMRYGIRSVSMDDIATQLGISKKTIYQYYADKEELVEAVVKEDVSQIQKDCVQCFRDAKDAVDEIFLTMEQILEQFRNMNPMVLYDLEKFHHRAYRFVLEHKQKFLFQLIKENIERGIREELYRPELDAEVMTRFRLESMMIAFNMDVFPPRRFNLADVTREIIEHYVYGLATPKGQKLIQKYKQEMTQKISVYDKK